MDFRIIFFSSQILSWSERLTSVKERALGDARESFSRAESTNCSQHLSLRVPACGEGGGRVYSSSQQVLRYLLCVVRGGKGGGGGGWEVVAYYACYTLVIPLRQLTIR